MFFFFQAEDGIRDYKVTGVQTCALPIFFHRILGGLEAGLQTAKDAMEDTQVRAPITGSILELDAVLRTVISSPTLGGGTRSEERRGGKEGRSRWSPYH